MCRKPPGGYQPLVYKAGQTNSYIFAIATYNNRCDELATAAADGRDLLVDEGYEMDPDRLIL